MLAFLIRRVLIFIPMLFAISVASFIMIQAPPGDYIASYIAELQLQGEGGGQAEIDSLRKRYGLDQPVYVQYFKWIRGLLTWDLGVSFNWRVPVSDLVGDRLFHTLLLSIVTVLATWLMAFPIGIISAVKQYSFIDYFFTFTAYIGVGTPNFMIALVALYTAFTVWGTTLSGLNSPEYISEPMSLGKFVDLLKHMWIPMLIVGTDGTAGLTRIVRANMLDELNKPYVEAARSRGTPGWRVVLKYPTRIALNPFLSTVGWTLPALFSGTLIVSVVLNLPTIGPLLLEALRTEDMYMAGSLLMILSFLPLVGTLISDVLLAWSDPRIRLER